MAGPALSGSVQVTVSEVPAASATVTSGSATWPGASPPTSVTVMVTSRVSSIRLSALPSRSFSSLTFSVTS